MNRRGSYGRVKGSSFSRLRFLQARASSANPGMCFRDIFSQGKGGYKRLREVKSRE